MDPTDKVLLIILFCASLLILSLYACLNALIEALNENKREKDEDYNDFLDEDGNHVYYDRSVIEKTKFHLSNPDIPENEIRSFKRLIKELLKIDKSLTNHS